MADAEVEGSSGSGMPRPRVRFSNDDDIPDESAHVKEATTHHSRDSKSSSRPNSPSSPTPRVTVTQSLPDRKRTAVVGKGLGQFFGTSTSLMSLADLHLDCFEYESAEILELMVAGFRLWPWECLLTFQIADDVLIKWMGKWRTST